jgi:hypothetical protein
VALGEVAHGVVREPAAQQQAVQAADHRQLPRAGRQPGARLLGAEEDMDERSKQEARAVVEIVWQVIKLFPGAMQL